MQSQSLKTVFRRLLKEEKGVAFTEYTLLLTIVAIGTIGALVMFRTEIKNWFTDIVKGGDDAKAHSDTGKADTSGSTK